MGSSGAPWRTTGCPSICVSPSACPRRTSAFSPRSRQRCGVSRAIHVRIRQLVLVGRSLIGGSCALALKRAGAVGEVVGVGRTRPNLDAALARLVIDRAYTLDDPWARETSDADIVLVATPVAQFPSLFASLAGAIGPATVVTDAGSTKQDVIAAARGVFAGALPRFVPGHPVAGPEHPAAAAAAA